MAQEYVPSNDAMNEILDLQRDLHANNFAFYEEKHLWDSYALRACDRSTRTDGCAGQPKNNQSNAIFALQKILF